MLGCKGPLSLLYLDLFFPQAAWPGPAEAAQPTPWWPQTRSPICWTCTCSSAAPSPLPTPTRGPQVSGRGTGAGGPWGSAAELTVQAGEKLSWFWEEAGLDCLPSPSENIGGLLYGGSQATHPTLLVTQQGGGSPDSGGRV